MGECHPGRRDSGDPGPEAAGPCHAAVLARRGLRPLGRDDRLFLVAEARSWIGTPYRHQASLKGVGCDCLGLVRGVWRALHGEEPEAVPAYEPGWAEAGRSERLAEAAARHLEPVDIRDFEAGDVLLFRWRRHLPAKHAAIATSEGTMVHAQQGAAACEIWISDWWRRRIAYAFRFGGWRTEDRRLKTEFSDLSPPTSVFWQT